MSKNNFNNYIINDLFDEGNRGREFLFETLDIVGQVERFVVVLIPDACVHELRNLKYFQQLIMLLQRHIVAAAARVQALDELCKVVAFLAELGQLGDQLIQLGLDHTEILKENLFNMT